MATKFSNITSPDSDDDSATDAIISQAVDSSILEQIATLNSSQFSSSSLQTNLETRFQKLKSFPLANNNDSATPGLCTPDRASTDSDIQQPYARRSAMRKDSGKKLRDGSSSSLPSPPRRMCCFGCSSKKATNRKNKDRGGNDGILTDLSTFSLKEQQRKLKKAMKEEEKVSREAAKVVEWVKQASARVDVSGIDDLALSEDDKHK